LREHEQEFTRKGATLAAVGLGDAAYARSFRQETEIAFPLLIDDKKDAYSAVALRKATLLHLFRGDNARYRKRAKAGGHRQHKLGKDPLQLGGSFVFAPGNKDLFAHVSETFGDNASTEDLIKAIG
jgi:hypothetical protein